MAEVQPDLAMAFGGSTDPCAFINLASLGLFEDQAPMFSQALCEHLQALLGLEPTRIYILFQSPLRTLWGWNGRTFK